MVELFAEPGALSFAVVEVTREPADAPTSLIVMLAAASDVGPVGLAFELAMLNGARAVHPFRITSIGEPTEALIAACGGKKAAGAPARWTIEGFATAEWRETSQRSPMHFKPQDLTWERARFSLTLSVGSTLESGTLELALEQERSRFGFEPRRFGKLLARARQG
ncbi:MAG: hypothetical protein GQE15_37715 [Archangiaceae bacterium]|nr:hypothetical protein [Archangiaceae bacterium]